MASVTLALIKIGGVLFKASPVVIVLAAALITMVYSALFATGFWIYSKYFPALLLTCLAGVSSWCLVLAWPKISSR